MKKKHKPFLNDARKIYRYNQVHGGYEQLVTREREIPPNKLKNFLKRINKSLHEYRFLFNMKLDSQILYLERFSYCNFGPFYSKFKLGVSLQIHLCDAIFSLHLFNRH